MPSQRVTVARREQRRQRRQQRRRQRAPEFIAVGPDPDLPPPVLGSGAFVSMNSESDVVDAGFDDPDSEQRDAPPPPTDPGDLSISQSTSDSLAVLNITTLDGSQQWESSCEEVEAIDVVVHRRRESARRRRTRRAVDTFLSTGQRLTDDSHVSGEDGGDLTTDEVIEHNRRRAQSSLALWTGIVPDDLRVFMKKCGDPYPPKICYGCSIEDAPVGKMVEIVKTFSSLIANMIASGQNINLCCERAHKYFKRAIYPHLPCRQDKTHQPMWRTWQIRHHLLFHSMNSEVQLWREVMRSNVRIQKLTWQAEQSVDLTPKVNTESRAERKQLIWLLERDPEKFCFKSSEAFYDMSKVGQILGVELPALPPVDGSDRVTI